MINEITKLKDEIKQIKERNTKVEADKAWETSIDRKLIIAVITYILVGFYLTYLKIDRPWLNAIVPTTGFILSTLTLSWVKTIWLNKRFKR